ncbi:MAG: hypothetical protein ACQER3_09950 [Pseudomonadota bacterium]
MSFSIKKNIPVNVVSESGEILSTESRDVTHIYKVESFTSLAEGFGTANVSKTAYGTDMVTYSSYPFVYTLDKPIFEQAEEQVIALPEFDGAVKI